MKFNPIKHAFSQFMSYVGLSILLFMGTLLSLLLGGGALLAASYHTSFKLYVDEEPVPLIPTLIKGLKKTWGYASVIYGLSILLAVGLFFVFNYAGNVDETWVRYAVAFSVVYLVLFNLYVYALHAIFEHTSIIHLIKNTLLFMHIHAWTSFKLLGTVVLFVMIIIFIHPVMFLLGLSLYLLLTTIHLIKVFTPYINHFKGAQDENNL